MLKRYKKGSPFGKPNFLGADGGTRTHKVSHTPLKRARLPVSPHPHLLFVLCIGWLILTIFSSKFQPLLRKHRYYNKLFLFLQQLFQIFLQNLKFILYCRVFARSLFRFRCCFLILFCFLPSNLL